MKLKPMHKKSSGVLPRLLLLAVLLAAIGAAAYAFIRDGGAPSLALRPQTGAASYATEFSLDMASARAGLKECVIIAEQDGKRVEILRKSYADKPLKQSESFRLPREAGFKEGPMLLAITVRDHALLAAIGRGKTSLEQKLALDFTPPKLSVTPGIHNVNQGGGGVVSYTISKPVEMTGVQVGAKLFPAFRQDSGEYVCFFAMPHDTPPGQFKPKVVARDQAGNEASQFLSVLAVPKTFKSDKLNIPDEFLNDKMGQYSALYPAEKSPLDMYKRVNTELRKQNEEELLKIGQDTAPKALWAGPFLRLPGSASRAGFGDQRDYFHNGEKIDHQTHMGVDLASTAAAPVPAANSGRVVYAGFFGIYGNCVIIDHGMGLQSLYSHLSEMSVTKGADVTRGQTIGHTGATGLAGGDHLHFGVLISGVQVSPVEWWDEHWIRDNILKHLGK